MMRDPAFTQTMQIGIVVRDLDATMRKYVDEYGIGPWKIYEFNRHDMNKDITQNEISLFIDLATSSLECLSGDCDSVYRVRPPCIKGKMRDYLDHFILGYAILARSLKVMSQLFRPIQSNQSCNRDETTIPLRESWTFPDFAEQHVVC